MKIKEIETLTGMSRDNIRFYEKCGLLIPNRNDNGYRDYNEDDVTTLKRIKLLRSLHLSIEDIKDIQINKIDLVNHLDEHIKLLEVEKVDLDKSMETCRQMILDHVTYNDLDAQEYLQNFEMNNELKDDVIPRLKSPIRRCFARGIDLSLYRLIFESVFVFIFNGRLIDSFGVDLLITITSLITMLLLEPFLLSKFGTTFGKYLLSLKITDEDGNYLSYKDAFDRTFNVIIYGYGCCVPIVTSLCLIINFRKCNKNQEFIWEEGNVQTLTKESTFKIFSVVIYYLIAFIITFIIVNYSTFPFNRGELTLSEFSQNYNFISKQYKSDTVFLDEQGNWKEKEVVNGSYVISSIEHYPKLNYIIENNELIEINFKVDKNEDVLKYVTADYVRNYIILSFIKSQESYGILNFDAESIINKHIRYNDFNFETYGLEIIQNVEFDDELSAMGYENYTVEFTIRKK